MDLVLNNLQRLICHKIQPINQPTNLKIDLASHLAHGWVNTYNKYSISNDFDEYLRGNTE